MLHHLVLIIEFSFEFFFLVYFFPNYILLQKLLKRKPSKRNKQLHQSPRTFLYDYTTTFPNMLSSIVTIIKI